MDGVLGVDKPRGPTSHDVVQGLRRVLRTRRIGHSGTLDPDASGVLLVCIGQATKLSRFLMSGEKEYRATLRLGLRTETGDRTGTPVGEPRPVRVSLEEILAATRRWVGDVEQVPPMVSALKRGGVPLYRLARAGIEVEREARRVRIAAIEVLGVSPPFVTVLVRCGSGTYVRALAEDIGEALGCGAHLFSLRRTRVGALGLGACVRWDPWGGRPDEAWAERMMSPDEGLSFLAALDMDERDTHRIRTGLPIRAAGEWAAGSWVRLRDPERRLVAVGLAGAGSEGGSVTLRPVRVLDPLG